jgi:hypothetical protein
MLLKPVGHAQPVGKAERSTTTTDRVGRGRDRIAEGGDRSRDVAEIAL